jgi:carboxyl-terminal processing protease
VRRRSLAIASLFLPIVLGAFLLGTSAKVRASMELFNQVFAVVSSTAVDSLPEDRLYELAARGLIRELGDPYADLLSAEERASFERNAIGNRYAGTGMTIRSHRGKVTAFRVFAGSPAEAAGLVAGDRIVAVAGTSVVGWTSDSVTTLLLGPANTEVDVSVERAGVSTPIRTTIRRAVIRVPAVPFTMMLENNIGYIPIQRFNEVAAADVATAVIRLGQQGARGYILDLRGNGGGDLYQSLRMAGLFLEEGSEISRVQHRGKPPEIYRAEERPLLSDAPIVVLVDGASASASEIVAGSLQDQDRALVVGTRTFGKGLVQTQMVLESGWAVRLTTGKWYTPSGRSIQAEHLALGDGRFVEDTVLDDADRPVYRSTAGREVLGGGGVTPDLIVQQDTASSAEQALARAAGAQLADLQDAIFEVARSAAASSPNGFVPSPAWRDSVITRVEALDLAVTRAQFAAASTTIDRLIDAQVAGLVGGDAASFVHRMDDDRVLAAALERISEAPNRVRLLGLNR